MFIFTQRVQRVLGLGGRRWGQSSASQTQVQTTGQAAEAVLIRR